MSNECERCGNPQRPQTAAALEAVIAERDRAKELLRTRTYEEANMRGHLQAIVNAQSASELKQRIEEARKALNPSAA